MDKNKQNHILQPNTGHLMIHTFFPFLHLTHQLNFFFLFCHFVFKLYTKSSPPQSSFLFPQSAKSFFLSLSLSIFLPPLSPFTENWLSPAHAGHSSFWQPEV